MWIEAPILKENLSSGGFFGGMYRRTYGSTDRRTDGQTDRKRGGGGMSDMSPSEHHLSSVILVQCSGALQHSVGGG